MSWFASAPFGGSSRLVDLFSILVDVQNEFVVVVRIGGCGWIKAQCRRVVGTPTTSLRVQPLHGSGSGHRIRKTLVLTTTAQFRS